MQINHLTEILKRAGTSGIVLLMTTGWLSKAHAIEPPLKDRSFFRGSPLPTGKQPWIDLRSLKLDNQGDAKKLQLWLLDREKELATWPPRYRSESEITRLIEEWQEKKSFVVNNEAALLISPESGALVATFWSYGHHLDEPKAADSAYAVLDQLQKKFPDSPLPPLLRGMLLNETGGKNASQFLAEAKGKTSDKGLLGMAELTLAARCMVSHRPHRAVMALTNSIDECESCWRGYEYMMQLIPGFFLRPPNIGVEKPYILARANDAIVVGSHLFGFYLQLPLSWNEPSMSAYEPSKPISIVSLKAPALPDSGLIHGLSVFSAIPTKESTASALPEIVEQLAKQDSVQSFSTIEPLAQNQYLKKWYRIDTRMTVGKNDHITIIAASGLIAPIKWTRSEHAKLSDNEPLCEPDIIQKTEPDKVNYWHLPGAARIDAPVEITVLYHGSRNTYKQSAEQLKKIISKIQINERSGSEFFGYR